ncbi:toxin-antitoxin system, toxin component, PIN domain protein, partial [Oesophagostomum dentatum]
VSYARKERAGKNIRERGLGPFSSLLALTVWLPTWLMGTLRSFLSMDTVTARWWCNSTLSAGADSQPSIRHNAYFN